MVPATFHTLHVHVYGVWERAKRDLISAGMKAESPGKSGRGPPRATQRALHVRVSSLPRGHMASIGKVPKGQGCVLNN